MRVKSVPVRGIMISTMAKRHTGSNRCHSSLTQSDFHHCHRILNILPVESTNATIDIIQDSNIVITQSNIEDINKVGQ